MNILKIGCLLMMSVIFGKAAFSQTPNNDPNKWVVQWYDDFTSKSLSVIDDDWDIANDADHGGEPQVYRNNSNNIVANSSGVILTAIQTTYTCTPCTSGNSYQVHKYTSGQISSRNTRMVQYGYVEASIKLDDKFGLFPAFWTWREVGSDYDEIDICEMIPGAIEGCQYTSYYNTPYYDKYHLTNNIHLSNNQTNEHCGESLSYLNVNYINDYTSTTAHKYAIEWSPSKIIWYIDDKAVRTTINPGYPGVSSGQISQSAYIILNLALNNAVNYPTIFDGSTISYFTPPTNPSYGNQTSINSANGSMTIEHVAYYKLNQDCGGSPLTITSSNLNDADSLVKKNIQTSGTISLSSSKIWRACEYVLINGDFTLSSGSELYIDTNPSY